MAYTLEQQISRDIDWYFKDANHKTIHVASAGGKLPRIIEENDNLMDLLHSQILELPFQYDVIINPILEQFVFFETEEYRELYLNDFIEMAKRGLISIDKTNLGNYEDTNYHIVAYPKSIISKEKLITISSELTISQREIKTSETKPFNLFEYFDDGK